MSSNQIPGLSFETSKTVTQILKTFSPPQQKVWVFGSRARGTQRENSDLDLLFSPDLSLSDLAKIREAFEESTLPFEVDLVNESDLAPEYKKSVAENKIQLL